jgi:hypothetical protein
MTYENKIKKELDKHKIQWENAIKPCVVKFGKQADNKIARLEKEIFNLTQKPLPESYKEDVAKAMRAAKSGSAYHWPTVAIILADEIERLQKVSISQDWLPTLEGINSLPCPIRTYIHDLITLSDPAGMVIENAHMRVLIKECHDYIIILKQRERENEI